MSTPRPLLVTNDPDLLDDMLRLAAAADVEVDVAVDPIAAKARWSAAPLVLLGADLAASTVVAQSPSRLGILLVGRESPAGDRAPDGSLTTFDAVLRLPEADDEIVERLARASTPTLARGQVVGVLGGCGGAGASVLATALGMSAVRRHQPALLVDLDPLGGGLDLLVGIEHAPGLRWPDLAGATGRLAPAALREALPGFRELAVLSFARKADQVLSADAICAVVDSGRRSGTVILDLPRQTHAWAVAVGLVDELILVVPADVRATSAARVAASALAGSARSAGVVVRRRSACTLTADDVAETVSLPLLGQARAEPGLGALLAGGRPLRLRRRGPLSTLCDQLLDRWREPVEKSAA